MAGRDQEDKRGSLSRSVIAFAIRGKITLTSVRADDDGGAQAWPRGLTKKHCLESSYFSESPNLSIALHSTVLFPIRS